MNEEATERGRLRELLLDGVAAPPDADAMFDRTFSGAGDDGVHLLPPADLFDAPPADRFDEPDPEPFDDPGTDAGYEEAAGPTEDAGTWDAGTWSEPVSADDPAADGGDPGTDPGDPGSW